MVRITVHGHRPAFMRPVATAERLPAEVPDGSLEIVKKKNLGFIKIKIHRPISPEIALRQLVSKRIIERRDNWIRDPKFQIKTEPYISKKGFLGENRNCSVPVTPGAQSTQRDHQTVVCRHFGTVFALHPGKKSDLMKRFSSEQGIQDIFNAQLTEVDTTLNKIIRQAPQSCKHVLSSDNLGRYLTSLAATLNETPQGQGRPKEANCLLLTANHVMALHVQRKSKHGVNYFAVKLYDPNNTATYKRVVKPTAQELTTLTLKDMLILESGVSAYGGGSHASISMVAVSLDADLQPQLDRATTVPSAENMHLVLAEGLHAELQAILNSNFGETEKLELLAAKSSDGTPGLFKALFAGHSETVEAFTQAVLNSDLGETNKVELLAAKSVDGIPGLYGAFQKGHPETVKAFAQTVLISNLGETEKLELLSASVEGVPGLYRAFKEGHPETVKAFVQAVLNSNLGEKGKLELLAASKAGIPALCKAFLDGNTEIVDAFAQAVLNSSLGENGKVELLAASVKGMPGLRIAFHEGDTETVKAFAQAVLNSNLGETRKVELLAAKSGVRIPGLLEAFRLGKNETVDAFVQAVESSELSAEKRMGLLGVLNTALSG